MYIVAEVNMYIIVFKVIYKKIYYIENVLYQFLYSNLLTKMQRETMII